tara:strand:- start:2669 stop:3397 length:729 start_codon:yes stop_codon:yes gene_type:complete
MAQNIGKKRGKSLIKETLENRRKAKRKDPEGYKNFPKDQLLGLGETALEVLLYKGRNVAKKFLTSGKTFTKKRGGLTNTVPPKRGPNPQGYKNGADVNFYAGGNENFQYGGGKASYTLSGDNYSLTPNISGSVMRSKGKTVKKSFDTVGLKGDYKLNKKTKLKGEVSRNVHGGKNYRGMIEASYKNNNKEYKAGINEAGKVSLGFKMGFKHGGCPYREAGVKSNIQGVSGIQLKGQKFTGTK